MDKVNIIINPPKHADYIEAILRSHGFRKTGAGYGPEGRDIDFEFEPRDEEEFQPEPIEVNTPFDEL